MNASSSSNDQILIKDRSILGTGPRTPLLRQSFLNTRQELHSAFLKACSCYLRLRRPFPVAWRTRFSTSSTLSSYERHHCVRLLEAIRLTGHLDRTSFAEVCVPAKFRGLPVLKEGAQTLLTLVHSPGPLIF